MSIVVLGLLSLAACNRGSQSKDAVRQAVIDRLNSHGLNVAGMNVEVTSVKFNGNEADATVSITPKGGPSGSGMSMPYHLQQQSGKWVVTGTNSTSGNPHGAGSSIPGAAPENPHGGAMPGADNPHGGAMPPAAAGGGDGKMPSPEDLPPAGKKK